MIKNRATYEKETQNVTCNPPPPLKNLMNTISDSFMPLLKRAPIKEGTNAIYRKSLDGWQLTTADKEKEIRRFVLKHTKGKFHGMF